MPEASVTAAGTSHTMWLSFRESSVQACPPTLTACAGPSRWKPAPVRVSGVPPPAEPRVGVMSVIAAC